MIKLVPVTVICIGSPTLAPKIKLYAVMVDNPDTGAVIELKPTKFIWVTAVPTVLPPNCKSTPEITLDNKDPSPLKTSPACKVTFPVLP